jgi:hypothetical protein
MHRVAHGTATASVMFTRTVIDRSELRDQHNHPEVEVAELLDRAERAPSADVWQRLDALLIVETECWCSAGFAALPRLSALAQSGAAEYRDHAIDLASMIVMALHRNGEHDDLVRANPAALATLHRLAESRLPGMSGRRLTCVSRCVRRNLRPRPERSTEHDDRW